MIGEIAIEKPLKRRAGQGPWDGHICCTESPGPGGGRGGSERISSQHGKDDPSYDLM